MTGVFDGMAGVLNGVLGASVTIHPGGGAGQIIQAVLREKQVEVADEHGEAVLDTLPVLKAQTGDVTLLVPDDLVIGSDGVRWIVRYRVPSDSPAADRFETFVLRKEEV